MKRNVSVILLIVVNLFILYSLVYLPLTRILADPTPREPQVEPTYPTVALNELPEGCLQKLPGEAVTLQNNALLYARELKPAWLGHPYDQNPQAIQAMQAIQRLLQSRGTQLILVPVPPRTVFDPSLAPHTEQVQKYRQLIRELQRAGVPAVDVTSIPTSGLKQVSYKYDIHWTPEFAWRVAKQVGKLKGSTGGEPITTLVKSPAQRTDSDQPVIPNIRHACHVSLPHETMTAYTLESKASASEDALLGNPDPGVVLIGTSFSGGNLGFPAFLEHTLHSPVTNYAVGAGGTFTAMKNFLETPPDAQPSVLVWEIFLYDIENESPEHFTQLQAALKLNCPRQTLSGNWRKYTQPVKVILKPHQKTLVFWSNGFHRLINNSHAQSPNVFFLDPMDWGGSVHVLTRAQSVEICK